MTRIHSILLLAPDIYAHGGVQRYMEMLVHMLCELPPDKFSSHVLTLNDRSGPHHPTKISIESCSGSKIAFVFGAVRATLKNSLVTAIAGHVRLASIAWLLKCARLIDRYVIVLHGMEAWRPLSPLGRRAARGASYIVSTTQYTARQFGIHNGVQAERFVIIPLGIEEANKLNDESAACERPGSILTVARLSSADSYKGIDNLISALRRVKDRDVPGVLNIVGSGDDVPRLKRLVHTLKLEDSVVFHGSLPDVELDRLYRTSSIFAMPSSKEGFGIVFLEAMRHAKPCIGGNHGGTPEVVAHAQTGFVVDYGADDDLAHYLFVLLTNSHLRREMGEAGRSKLERSFTFERMRMSWCKLLSRN